MLKEILLNGKYETSCICGAACMFCRFDPEDDAYHCLFFPEEEETILINMCAEESVRFSDCPVDVREAVG